MTSRKPSIQLVCCFYIQNNSNAGQDIVSSFLNFDFNVKDQEADVHIPFAAILTQITE